MRNLNLAKMIFGLILISVCSGCRLPFYSYSTTSPAVSRPFNYSDMFGELTLSESADISLLDSQCAWSNQFAVTVRSEGEYSIELQDIFNETDTQLYYVMTSGEVYERILARLDGPKEALHSTSMLESDLPKQDALAMAYAINGSNVLCAHP